MTFKELLETGGFSQTAFARKFNIPLRTVQNWAGGSSSPPEWAFNLLVEASKSENKKMSFESGGYTLSNVSAADFVKYENAKSEKKKESLFSTALCIHDRLNNSYHVCYAYRLCFDDVNHFIVSDNGIVYSTDDAINIISNSADVLFVEKERYFTRKKQKEVTFMENSFFYDYAELLVLHEEIEKKAESEKEGGDSVESFFEPIPEKYEIKLSEIREKISSMQEEKEKFETLAEKIGLKRQEDGTFTRKEIEFAYSDYDGSMICRVVDKDFSINDYLKSRYKEKNSFWKAEINLEIEKIK